MSLEKNIMQHMKAAMKEKNQAKLRGIRAIKSAILLAKTEKAGVEELSEEQEVKMLQKLAKQRKDSIAVFQAEGRDDLVQKEQEELDVINSFLPEMMSEETILEHVKTIIAEVGASTPQDMGKVMGKASGIFAGKADMGLVSAAVKKLLMS